LIALFETAGTESVDLLMFLISCSVFGGDGEREYAEDHGAGASIGEKRNSKDEEKN